MRYVVLFTVYYIVFFRVVNIRIGCPTENLIEHMARYYMEYLICILFIWVSTLYVYRLNKEDKLTKELKVKESQED